MSASKTSPHAVLIDDDPLVRSAWLSRASDVGKDIWTFESIADFNLQLGTLGRDVLIFVDSNLSEGLKGEDIACSLHGAGFKNLFLSTGYPASYFPQMPWLKGIVGKYPPDWLFEKPGPAIVTKST